MKTAMQILSEELENYRNESGNDVISIDLLIQGIDGIYSNLEKQQSINFANFCFKYDKDNPNHELSTVYLFELFKKQ